VLTEPEGIEEEVVVTANFTPPLVVQPATKRRAMRTETATT
jgi:hypothetical protein